MYVKRYVLPILVLLVLIPGIAFSQIGGGIIGGDTSLFTFDRTFADNIAAIFGTDGDFHLEYDSANGYLQLGDGTNDFLQVVDDGATATFTFLGAIVATGSITGYLEGASVAGAHTVTTAQAKGGYILVTAVGDVDLPDVCDSATFASLKVVVRDAAETVSVTLANSQEDTIKYPGLSLTAGDEIDSPGGELDELTLVCCATNTWCANGTLGWTDGGTDD